MESERTIVIPHILNQQILADVDRKLPEEACGLLAGLAGCVVKIFEITLNNGQDPLTSKTIGLQTGDPRQFSSYHQLLEAFKKQITFFADLKIKGNNIIDRLYADYMPVPFLSLFIDDCIDNGTTVAGFVNQLRGREIMQGAGWIACL